jgi:hypothetical protein
MSVVLGGLCAVIGAGAKCASATIENTRKRKGKDEHTNKLL